MIPAAWDANQDSCEWTIFDRQGKVLRRGKDILNKLPACDETEIVVPAAMVGFISAQLPPGNQTKVLNALPFLVEAGLISAPEETHAVLASQSNAQIIVAVIQKKWVQNVLAKLGRTEIFPIRMFPETLLPELPHHGWAIVCRGHESFIRTSASQGLPLDIDVQSETVPLLLNMALQQTTAENRPSSFHLYGETPKHLTDWTKQLDIPFVRASQQEWLVNPSKPLVNLLQGEFQPAGGFLRRLVAFKPVAITLLCLLLMQISFSLLDYAMKTQQNRKLDQAMISQFKATFPNANTIVDAPLQMQRNLEDLKHGAGQSGNRDYISLLSNITSSIGAIPADKLKSMSYQDGTIILSLTMPDMSEAKAISQRLNSAGLISAIEDAHTVTQGAELNLTISAGGI